MIIFDFEWNRGYDKKRVSEILQIGAVRVDGPGGPIRDVFNRYIRPSIHKKFDIGARKLPDLQESRDSDLDFPTAYGDFRAWCGGETEFASWGGDDFDVLKQNCEFWDLELIVPEKTYDIQAAFAYMLGAGRVQIALMRAAVYCGVPDVFTFHNALNDAMYTAVLSEWVTEEALTHEPEPSLRQSQRRFSEEEFPPQAKERLGPFREKDEALNSRNVRRLTCPVCGKRTWVRQWWPLSELQYYSSFICPDHGRFLCRLTLSQTEDGQWRGRRAVPAITGEEKDLYLTARRNPAHQCRVTGQKRKKRRRYGRRRPGGGAGDGT